MRFHIVIFLASGAVSALSQAAPSNPIVAVTGGKVRGVLLNPQVAVFKAYGGRRSAASTNQKHRFFRVRRTTRLKDITTLRSSDEIYV